jgi:hypothetical protein
MLIEKWNIQYRINASDVIGTFVPDPLPPSPPIACTSPLIMAQQGAATALGRLDGITL